MILQILLIFLSMAYWHHPLLIPVKLLIVLLHEISHGLMALATGGTVQEIAIAIDETGACRTSGGNDHLIISAGYLGSMFCGGMIICASRCKNQTSLIYGMLAILLLAFGATVIQDPYSRKFALTAAAAALIFCLLPPSFVSALTLRIVGTIGSLYALTDIYNDTLSQSAVDYHLESDASAFAELTGVPSTTVGLVWMLIAVALFIASLHWSLYHTQGASPQFHAVKSRAEAGSGC
jgi:hypothetical protein